ncbi:hypothetical protein M9H77_11848 [Catharanthus roseus]|uniref:Uncharacterized protein n=1 Tax=Catharanthus roseus TaxID=4058 RepID=A0ACC0BFU1_CATRO|nr:hypothetical protein M9H77_11848 [Catharanthus roseus]
MVWEPIFWLGCFLTNMTLIAFNIYQITCLSDLEADYLNPYESSARINSVVIPEFLVHGVFCFLFLVTGHWLFFLITCFPAYHNARKFMKRQHLMDVTEAFRHIDAQKRIRVFKLGFYLVLFVFVLIRSFTAGTFSILLSIFHDNNEELDIRSSVLEF